ncbi:MAG: hypothetical protein FWE02_07440 [Defluviitaleaceae bacterium]|nr:hypothetical protein [Defluviitaleaceae bacterium]
MSKPRNKGNAYIFVLILMLSLFTMLTFLLRISTGHAIMQVDREPGLRILAQSGIDIGFAEAHSSDNRINPIGFTHENGELLVVIESHDAGYLIISRAGHIEIQAIIEREGERFNILSVREIF